MFRVLLGFILGAVVTFYSLPYIEDFFGEIPRPSISQIKKTVTSEPSIISPLHPDFQNRVSLAYQLAVNSDQKHLADGSLLHLISELAEKDSQVASLANYHGSSGITNEEAAYILEQYMN